MLPLSGSLLSSLCTFLSSPLFPPLLLPSLLLSPLGEGLSSSRLSLLKRTSSIGSYGTPPHSRRTSKESRASRSLRASVLLGQLTSSYSPAASPTVTPTITPTATPRNSPPASRRSSPPPPPRSPALFLHSPQLLVGPGEQEGTPQVLLFPPEEDQRDVQGEPLAPCPDLSPREEVRMPDPAHLAMLLAPSQGKYPSPGREAMCMMTEQLLPASHPLISSRPSNPPLPSPSGLHTCLCAKHSR